MSRRSRDGDVWPDNYKEALVGLVFAATVVSILLVWQANPYAIHELTDVVDSAAGRSPPSADSAEVLYLSSADAAYLNRIFRERDREIGYCGLVEGERLIPWLADTTVTTTDHLEFSTSNCPGGRPPATIHTHPRGNLGLSIDDRLTFVSKDYEYMCVQADRIVTDPGATASALACYEKVLVERGFRYRRMRVVITAADSTARGSDSRR